MSRRSTLLTLLVAAIAGCLPYAAGLSPAAAGPADAGAWTIQPSPNPSGVNTSELTAVACPGAQTCMAVGDEGDYSLGSGLLPLGERWNGTRWTIVPVPVTDPASLNDGILSAISCSSSSSCMAVGYTVRSSDVRTLAEHWDGRAWTITSTPQPAHSSWTELEGVSCTARGGCVAVGGQIGPAVDFQEAPLAMVWRGGQWRLRAVPNPHAENGSDLDAVSCATLASCQATGGYTFADVASGVFAATWNGGHWTLEKQPNPPGEDNAENAIACTSRAACLTVGTDDDVRDQTQLFAELWNGSSWSLQNVRIPSGIDTAALFGLSCAQSGDCVAVGDGADNFAGDPDGPLAAHWDGSTWTFERTPDPAGATLGSLAGVACPSLTQCVAVGSSYTSGVTTTLVEVRSPAAG